MDTFNKIMDRVDGYKTYILITLALVTLTLGYAGVLEQEAMTMILEYLGLGTLAAFAHKGNKIINKD